MYQAASGLARQLYRATARFQPLCAGAGRVVVHGQLYRMLLFSFDAGLVDVIFHKVDILSCSDEGGALLPCSTCVY